MPFYVFSSPSPKLGDLDDVDAEEASAGSALVRTPEGRWAARPVTADTPAPDPATDSPTVPALPPAPQPAVPHRPEKSQGKSP